MSSPRCRKIRPELGAYVLGALDAGDERRVREHLDSCADCAAEAASLQTTGSALSLTDLTMVERPPEPSPDVLPNLLQRVSLARRRRRITTAAVAAAAAVVVALGGVAVVDAVDDSSSQDVVAGEPAETVSAREGNVAVAVDVWDRDWGSALTVEITGVPAGYRCSLIAVGADGQRETAATWVVPSGGYNEGTGLTMDGAHGLHSWEVERYEVVTSDGELLATLPLDD